MISNLRKISEGLVSEFELENALRLIALEACPSGKTARTYLIRVLGQSRISVVARFDQDLSDVAAVSYTTQFIPMMFPDGIYPEVTIELGHDFKFLAKFEETMGQVESDLLNTTFLMPLAPDFIIAMSLHSKADGTEERTDYFRTLRAIIQLYLSNLIVFNGNSKIIAQRKLSRNLELRLTERQELILELMQSGKTNPVIARLLGYSESLIRQETISIYRKLGIKGRRDLPNIAQRRKKS